MYNQDEYNYTNITLAGPTTTVVATGKGKLHAITFNTPAATAVVTVYDNTAATGTKIATFTIAAGPLPFTWQPDVYFAKGLTITTATAAQDLTVAWCQA